MLTADERLQSELEATRIEKSREEDALRRAFDRAVNRLGYVRAVEAIARECEGIGERDNSDVWAERAAILFQAAEFGEEI